MEGLVIREIKEEEHFLLDDFLYEAIFVPKGTEKPPRDIINGEELRVYVKDFGKFKDDNCLVAEFCGIIVGACWARIMNDYGHIDNKTPSLAVSLYEEYRGRGIGTALVKGMLELLKEKNYGAVSLSVQKTNYAVDMYKKIGFKTAYENDEEYIMIYVLKNITEETQC